MGYGENLTQLVSAFAIRIKAFLVQTYLRSISACENSVAFLRDMKVTHTGTDELR